MWNAITTGRIFFPAMTAVIKFFPYFITMMVLVILASKTFNRYLVDCGGGVGNVDSSAGGMGQDSGNGGAGSGSDSGEPMDADTRARELARRKEEARRKRRKKKRTGSSLVSSCFQGKTNNVLYSSQVPRVAPIVRFFNMILFE